MEREKSLKIFESLFTETDLSGSHIDTHGWDSRVLFLQNGTVIKIPLANGYEKLEREYCVLKSVKPLLGDLVPDRIALVMKKFRGETLKFLSYNVIKGITLDDAAPLSRDRPSG